MITPQDIAAKAARAYVPLLRSWLRGEVFATLDIAAGAPAADFRSLERQVAALMAGAKTQREVGYLVEMQTRTTRTYGAQTLPTRIVVESAADLVFLAGKTEEFAAFVADVALIRAAQPLLEPLLQTQPLLVVEQHGSWPELLRVCAYFQASPRPQLFIRELPIAVHTKFIEQHAGALMHLLDVLLPPTAINSDARQFVQRYGLRSDAPLVRMRLLDARLRAQLGLPLADIAATTADLAALPAAGLRYVIVENKMVFLTLPPLADTIAIFGGGFQVDLLRELDWLRAGPIWYWGDLDAQGFQILARLRAIFPHVVSLMMDGTTFDAFSAFAVAGTACRVTELLHLTADEQALFAHLARTNLRLEQERISHAYAVQRIHAAVVRP